MATGKRYYWLKLKGEFMKGEEVDFLMSQPNGSDYVVLYQMLCLSTINTRGLCARFVGEALIPYDIDKIKREVKWFKRDTIIVALELYKKLGLVYEQENGILQITDFESIVGSETDWAAQKQRQRLARGVDNVPELSTPMSPQEIRDKSLEERDKNSIVHSSPACAGACEREKMPQNDEDELPPDERKRRLQQKYLGGTLGQGIVMMSMEQFDAICENYSIEEIEKYFEIIVDCENRGKSWKKKTHYQAFLDMAAQDRRV